MTRLKSTLLALSLLTASPAFAQTNITGDWDVTVTSPQGANTTPVTFKQDGTKVSGVFKSPQGTLPFEGGTLTGSDLKFTFTINAQGMELPITLTGTVVGDTISGKADFGGFAEGDWNAKRSAATTTTSSATTTTTTTTSRNRAPSGMTQPAVPPVPLSAGAVVAAGGAETSGAKDRGDGATLAADLIEIDPRSGNATARRERLDEPVSDESR